MLRYLASVWGAVSAFTVHEPPVQGGTGRIERADSLAFVQDGFCWRAALFSPFYLLFRGDWRALGVYLGVALFIALLLTVIGAKPDWMVWTFVLLNIVIGFEAGELTRWSLGRAGWQEIGSVSGRGREEAERRFFEAWLPTVPDAAPGGGNSDLAFVPPLSPAADFETRMEQAVKRLSARLRQRFAVKTSS